MEPSFYEDYYRHENNHWWFRWRFDLITRLVSSLGSGENFRILDAGCGTGQMTKRLGAIGMAYGLDSAPEAIAFARADAESGLETLVRWRLRAWGIRVRTQQNLVSVGRVDLLLGERLVVEVDGVENHASPEHRHRDLVRDANAAAWGFVTLRFDYAMVIHDWPTVELALRGLLDRGIHLSDR